MIERLPIAEPAQTRRAARRLFTEDRWSVLLVLALNSLAALAGLVAPWLLGRIVDQVGSGTAQMSTVDIMAAVILACAAAQLLLSRFARYYGHRFGERALAGTREEFVGDALSLPARVLERTGTGDLMTRGSADVAAIGTSLREAMPTLFVASLQVLFVFGALFALSPLLALCALVAVPPAIMISRWYLRRARPAYLQEGQADSEMSETLSELAEGARTVEAYGLEAAQLSAVDDRVELSRTARLRTLFLRNVFFPVVDLITSLPLLVIVLAGGYFISEDLLTLGVVVSGVLYAWQVMEPFDLIIDWLEQLQRSSAAFARIKGVGRAVPDQVASGAVPVDDRLVISELHYAYNDGKDVLHGVDLTVRPGEQLALVGPSGAGKSTLGRLLAGIDVPRQGSVTVGGVPVAELAPEVLRERVVLVTQEHHVFLGTVRDNLLIAAPDADDATLLNALDVVDAAWVRELPEGLDTMLGPDHLQPDAPQAQQLALARVVLADPHTVVLDEATALLDPRTARHVERAVAAVLAGRTVVAIAHRLQTARDSDRIAVVDHGRITELGTHDELITANGAYATLWRSWQDA